MSVSKGNHTETCYVWCPDCYAGRVRYDPWLAEKLEAIGL